MSYRNRYSAMSKSVPTSDEVMTVPSAPVKVTADAFSLEKNAPSTGWLSPWALICFELVGDVLSEAVVLAGAGPADWLADVDHGVGEAPLHLDGDLIGADVRTAEAVHLVLAVHVGQDLNDLVGEVVVGPETHAWPQRRDAVTWTSSARSEGFEPPTF